MKKSLILLVLFFLLSQPLLVEAFAPRSLEIKYPEISGAPPLEDVAVGLPGYVKYVFNFFIIITGLIALGALVYGGFRYTSSAGQPVALQDAKNQIFAAFLGILILMSSWLILTTINPDLINFKLDKPPTAFSSLTPGVYLCLESTNEIFAAQARIKQLKQMDVFDSARNQIIEGLNKDLKKIETQCWLAKSEGEIVARFNDFAQYAYTVPAEDNTLHGAIIYQESNFGGSAQVVYTLDPKVAAFNVSSPSSIRPFVLKKPRPGAYIEVFELTDFNWADPEKKSEIFALGESLAKGWPIDFAEVGSVKIEGELIVIFFEQAGEWYSDTVLDVILETDANLHNNRMGRWCTRMVFLRQEYYPCPQQMVIVSAGIY